MAVTSTTLLGVNVWQFSGNVTDAEIKTAWSALIVNSAITTSATDSNYTTIYQNKKL